jgi:hypothetical protein
MNYIAIRKNNGKRVHPASIFLNGSGVVWKNERDGVEGVDHLVSTKEIMVCLSTGKQESLLGGASGEEICDGHKLRITNREMVLGEFSDVIYEGFVEYNKEDCAFVFSNTKAPAWTYAIREGMLVEIIGHKANKSA